MKLALICDTHWGVRSDRVIFLDNNKQFLDQVFFPTLQKEQINHVVCLGDLVDRRKYINYNTAYRLRRDFIDLLMERNIEFHWILGNHDVYWPDNLEVSVASELYGYLSRGNDKFKFYTDPIEVILDKKILFIPWICNANREATSKLIDKTDAKICFGHLELTGFEMYKGLVNDHGDDPRNYKKFDIVCSGHYHHKSSYDNINYLGSHAEFIWSDYNDDHGFHIFDTNDKSLVFIRNPFNMFVKVFYNDANGHKPSIINPETLKNKIVKVVVTSRTNSDRYNQFMVECEKAQPYELMVVDDHLNLDQINDSNIVSETKSTLEIIREYIAQTNNTINATALDNLIVDLYKEASNL